MAPHPIATYVLKKAEKNAHYNNNNQLPLHFDEKYNGTLLELQHSFYNQRYDFMKECIIYPQKILEVGDVNGYNISSFGNSNSLSLNFKNFPNIDNRFKIADVNNGLFVNEKFDCGVMFETLEHIHNPILILNQMLDICKNGVFISIPYVKKTVCKLDLNGGHVFEFSPYDFKKILEYHNIKIVNYKKCDVLKLSAILKIFELHGILHKSTDTLFGVFKSFQLYYLQRIDGE